MTKRFYVSPLGEHDDAWLTVWSALTNRSKGDQSSSLLAFRVRERKSAIKELLEYSAQIREMDPDELFKLLRQNPKWLKENPAPGDINEDELPSELE